MQINISLSEMIVNSIICDGGGGGTAYKHDNSKCHTSKI